MTAILLASAPAFAQEFAVSAAAQTSSGRFIFDVPTLSNTITLGASLSAGRFGLDGYWPLLIQNSGAITYIGGQPVPTGGPRSGALDGRSRGERVPLRRGGSGAGVLVDRTALIDSAGLAEEPGPYRTFVGDPIVSARAVLVDDYRYGLHASVSAKLPLADPTDGIGTGKLDAGASVDATAYIGQGLLGVGLSHWVLGDLPELPLRDVTSASISVGRTLGASGRWTAMLAAYASTSVHPDLAAPASVGVALGRRLESGQSVFVTVGAGLSEASADWSVGLSWRLAERYRGALP
ncbi:MAG: hypothetical protein KF709_06655 [Gemmatimonadaceae bacterium]|nr:hypothetical protein [Gemmatimonadaceae bacterium]